ncbi:MAG: STAS domain-containing protein [Planctomycetaceae bacterium]
MASDDETQGNDADESVGNNGSAKQVTQDGILHVYEVGEVIVLGFAGKDVPSNFNVAHYREAIAELAKVNDANKIVFDLTGVRIVPSGILGLWASLNKQGIEIEAYNPSQDIREVLEITKLDQLITIKEVDV